MAEMLCNCKQGTCCMQGIHAVYSPFAPLVRQASESEAVKLEALFAACFSALAPFYEWTAAGEEWPEPTPYSYLTPEQRAPIQTAFHNLAYGIFEVVLCHLVPCCLDTM